MTETELYHEIHLELATICKVANVPFHYVRIESPIQQGVPDINVCIKGKEFWIECKVDEYDMTPLQKSWAVKREQCGGKYYVIEYLHGLFYLSDGYLIPKGHATNLSQIIDEIIIDLFGKDKLNG